MNILVTGGAGYIGSHVCKALAAAGHIPITYDNLSTGNRWAVKYGPLIEADLGDGKSLRSTLHNHQIEAVMHFAGLIAVGESVQKPNLYYHHNVACTINLLGAMQELGVQHIVFSSSAAVYGTPEVSPIKEDHPRQPISPYGWSKEMVERILEGHQTAGALEYVALRYFNAAGADPDGELGEAHEPETHLIPLVLDAALGRRDSIFVFGQDYDTPDGTCVRDYIHVQDLADAHAAALQYLVTGGSSVALNLGAGKGYSVQQVIDAVAEATGEEVPTKYGPRRDGDAPSLVADVNAAREVLKWQAQHSDLHNIVTTAAAWAKRV